MDYSEREDQRIADLYHKLLHSATRVFMNGGLNLYCASKAIYGFSKKLDRVLFSLTMR
jgi:hypothetical protein